jgi:hypothetical protein
MVQMNLATTENLQKEMTYKVKTLFDSLCPICHIIEDDHHNTSLRVQYDMSSRAIIDIKLYRSKRISLTIIEQAISHLIHTGGVEKIDSLIMVVSTNIANDLVDMIRQKYGVTLWDQKDLLFLLKQADLDQEPFIDFFDSVNPPSDSRFPLTSSIYNRNPSFQSAFVLKAKSIKIVPTRGQQLYQQLGSIAGRASQWVKFENTSFEILKYLFNKELSGWYRNFKIDQGSNRFEMVCRINSKHDYWNRISSEFNTRYVQFECRPYKDIFLYKNVSSNDLNFLNQAIRTVNFILTPNSDEQLIHHGSQGAFYDNGKLIFHLIEEDLGRMLTDRDLGNDATALLRERLDQAMYLIQKL